MITKHDIKKILVRYVNENNSVITKISSYVYETDSNVLSKFELIFPFFEHKNQKNRVSMRFMKQILALDASLKEEYFLDFISSLEILYQANLLTRVVFQKLLDGNHTQYNIQIIQHLNRSRLLNHMNCIAALTHKQQVLLSQALKHAYNSRILNQDMFDILISHPDPYALSLVFDSLSRSHLLNDVNREHIRLLTHPASIAIVIARLHEVNLLNQANINLLLNAENSWMISEEAVQRVWLRVPSTLFNQEVFQQMITHLRCNTVDAYVDQLVNHIQLIDNACAINPSQSTHTSSVHRSVSESIKRLEKRYESFVGSYLLVDETLCYLMNMIKNSNAGLKAEAALRFLERVVIEEHDYIDVSTGVSLKQFLALTFFAINDKDKRLGSLLDAQTMIIDGFYEVQRGYNLSDDGVDNMGRDLPICLGGTFNKIIEKLIGVHQDCTLKYITPMTATIKLSILVKELVFKHMQHAIQDLKSHACLTNLKTLIQQLKNEGCGIIFPSIKSELEERLFDEFGTLYHNKEDERFSSLIASAEYVDLSDLDYHKLYHSITNHLIKMHEGKSPSSLRLPWYEVNLYKEKNSVNSEVFFEKQSPKMHRP